MRYISIVLAAILVSACAGMDPMSDSSGGGGMSGSSASSTNSYLQPLRPGDTYYGN